MMFARIVGNFFKTTFEGRLMKFVVGIWDYTKGLCPPNELGSYSIVGELRFMGVIWFC